MSPNEYFDEHIPHRVNLLIAFRQRFSGRNPQITLQKEAYRDLFRCAKDISFVMVRFFCKEMGITLPKKDAAGVDDIKETPIPSASSSFGILKLSKATLKADYRFSNLLDVLLAANRAVAHIEVGDVDHSFTTETDDERIFGVIDWMEELIKSNIYRPSRRDLAHSMSLPNNVMY